MQNQEQIEYMYICKNKYIIFFTYKLQTIIVY